MSGGRRVAVVGTVTRPMRKAHRPGVANPGYAKTPSFPNFSASR